MNDVHDLLDAQMGTPPPAGIDLDAIVQRERRRLRVRQAGVGVSFAAVAGAAALLATTLVGGSSHRPDAAGPPPGTTVSGGSSSAVTANAREDEASRLSTVLQGLLHDAMPGAQFSRNPMSTALDEPNAGPLLFADAGTYFVAMAEVTDSAGVSNVIVRVGETNDALVQNSGCIPDPPPGDIELTCHKTSLGADGFQVNMTTKRGAFLRDLAEVVRPGDNVVDVEIANSVHYYKAERPTLNLTMAQLTALAKNPQLATKD